jgi:hypothetical protein
MHLILLSPNCISQPAHHLGRFFFISLHVCPYNSTRVLGYYISSALISKKRRKKHLKSWRIKRCRPMPCWRQVSLVKVCCHAKGASDKAYHIRPAKMHMHHATFRDTPLGSWLWKSRLSL